jgi:hypothetical protein
MRFFQTATLLKLCEATMSETPIELLHYRPLDQIANAVRKKYILDALHNGNEVTVLRFFTELFLCDATADEIDNSIKRPHSSLLELLRITLAVMAEHKLLNGFLAGMEQLNHSRINKFVELLESFTEMAHEPALSEDEAYIFDRLYAAVRDARATVRKAQFDLDLERLTAETTRQERW